MCKILATLLVAVFVTSVSMPAQAGILDFLFGGQPQSEVTGVNDADGEIRDNFQRDPTDLDRRESMQDNNKQRREARNSDNDNDNDNGNGNGQCERDKGKGHDYK